MRCGPENGPRTTVQASINAPLRRGITRLRSSVPPVDSPTILAAVSTPQPTASVGKEAIVGPSQRFRVGASWPGK